jgi:F420H(2)-dependent quinone reductase
LTVTGRKTGKRRTKPLLYMPDGDRYVVVASNGGRPDHPAWFLNVRANPDVDVQVGRRRFAARARIPEEGERDRLWRMAGEHYEGWPHYQTLTHRQLPVVVLEPA